MLPLASFTAFRAIYDATYVKALIKQHAYYSNEGAHMHTPPQEPTSNLAQLGEGPGTLDFIGVQPYSKHPVAISNRFIKRLMY